MTTEVSPVHRAERAILSACLAEPEALLDATEYLVPSDFQDERHREIFSEFIRILGEGKPIDPIIVQNNLRTFGKMKLCGGIDYVRSLSNDPFDTADAVAHCKHYLEVIKRESVRQTLIGLTRKWVQSLKTGNPEETLDLIQSDIMHDIRSGEKNQPVLVGDAIDGVLSEIDDRCAGKSQNVLIPSGLSRLDASLGGGFSPGELIILAARPSQGKSALALQIAAYAATKMIPTLVFSVEMSRDQNLHRILSGLSGLGLSQVRTGILTEIQRELVHSTARKLGDIKLWIDDSSGITPAKIRTTSRRLQSRNAINGGLKFIVLDYLQLLSGGGKFSNRVEEVSYISRCLKAIAKSLGAPLLALSQFSRDAARAGRPELHHLRESGSIEQDADVVLFLNPKKGDYVDLIIAKQRQGPLDTIPLIFNRELTRFVEV